MAPRSVLLSKIVQQLFCRKKEVGVRCKTTLSAKKKKWTLRSEKQLKCHRWLGYAGGRNYIKNPTWNYSSLWENKLGLLQRCCGSDTFTYFSFSLVRRAAVEEFCHQALQSTQRCLLWCLMGKIITFGLAQLKERHSQTTHLFIWEIESDDCKQLMTVVALLYEPLCLILVSFRHALCFRACTHQWMTSANISDYLWVGPSAPSCWHGAV